MLIHVRDHAAAYQLVLDQLYPDRYLGGTLVDHSLVQRLLDKLGFPNSQHDPIPVQLWCGDPVEHKVTGGLGRITRITVDQDGTTTMVNHTGPYPVEHYHRLVRIP